MSHGVVVISILSNGKSSSNVEALDCEKGINIIRSNMYEILFIDIVDC